MNMMTSEAAETAGDLRAAPGFLWLVYLNAFISGAVIMAFEMLGSRYLNPYFGSGIYTWAALIATVLIALMVGYFLGGWLADRWPTYKLLAGLIMASAVYMAFVPLAADGVLAAIFDAIESVRTGSLAAALALLFVPLTLLGVYSPFAIRLTLRSTEQSGRVAGRIYGISTFGSVFGTLFATFWLIPTLGSRSITYVLAGVAVLSGLSFLAAVPAITGKLRRAAAALAPMTLGPVAVLVSLGVLSVPALAQQGTIFERYDSGEGETRLLEQVETSYNNIFVTQRGDFITMSFRVRRRDETESVINLLDIGELPLPYTRAMTVALAYADKLESMLMIGLGGGTTSRYVSRHIKDMDVTVVELDGGVIRMAKKHFKLKEGPRYKLIERDGRVHLLRNRDARYDIVMVDAFRGGYVPFHLLTREFYELLKKRLAPGGVAVFNVHGGTRLFEATIKTLTAVFGHVETVPAAGSIITVVRNGPPLSAHAATLRAETLQAKHTFRYDLRILMQGRRKMGIGPRARVLTDDFAPVNLYDSIKKSNKKK
ncbi:MAG TPA: fused MFS/spermidine synthase [Alphaproteobacteria bacterium]|nr:fused MFS/spermidine synthase [Alphaproteobacteria bacterium]